MSIQRISFTSSLLSNIPTAKQEEIKEQEKSVEQETETEEVSDESEETEEYDYSENTDDIANPLDYKKSHTVRNWSIGLSAAAVLIGLGVAGRKGKLGTGLQKALGGGEKAAEHKAGDAAGHVKPGGETKVEEITTEEFEHITEKEPDFVYGGKKKTTTDEPIPSGSETKVETPKEEQTPTKVETIAEPPKAKTITKAEKAAIDAKLDTSLPKIEKEMLTIKAPTIQELEKMGFDMSKFNMTGKPESIKELIIGDKKYFLKYSDKGKLDYVYQGSKDTEYYYNTDATVSVLDGKISWLSFEKDRKHTVYYYNSDGTFDWSNIRDKINHTEYRYDDKGLLRNLQIKENDNSTIVKDIEYIHGTDKPAKITYGASSWNSQKALKIEIYDGKPTPLKEIYIKDGEEITEVV